MSNIKKAVVLFFTVISVIVLFSFVCLFFEGRSAYADSVESDSDLNYTLLTDEDGSQHYSVSVRVAAKPTIEIIVIPEEYNGHPVTDIANNGFMSCANLKKVILSENIVKIGNNAFMNCSKLERVGMPRVEDIGMNAFAMCPKLDRVYLPNTVNKVGANILRNNANKVFVRLSAEQVSAEWQSTWSNYFTGEIHYEALPEDTIAYREILDDNNENVIGYEIAEQQFLSDATSDVVIYDYYSPSAETPYLPVLNVCSEAFTFSQVNSVTFKRRTTDQSGSGITDVAHKINIRSNAFLAFLGNEVNFEVGVTFDHPENLQNVESSIYDAGAIIGDDNNKSIRIFEDAYVNKVTLPSDITFIPERMFNNCAYLEDIVFLGSDTPNNSLVSVESIGARAFGSCVGLNSLAIPSSVTSVGESVFYDWGGGAQSQTLNIDFYEGYLPANWSSNWNDGIVTSRTTIVYKPLTYVTLDLQNGTGETISLGVKPGLEMPAIAKPDRRGYVFCGIYSERNGRGLQYYTDEMTVRAPWQEGDPLTMYVNWEIIVYNIYYPSDLSEINNPNPTTYTVEDDIEFVSLYDGGYKYSFDVNGIAKGTVGDITLSYTKTPVDFIINYEVDDLKGCINNNSHKYKVTDEFLFTKLECFGYTFEWIPSGIQKGSIGDLTVRGVWTPNQYNIIYKNITEDTSVNNPETYAYGQEYIFIPATRGGYAVVWDKVKIPAGTYGDFEITATYYLKTLDQCLNNGVYEIWNVSQFSELKNQPNGGLNRRYKLMNYISFPDHTIHVFEPIQEFKGTFDGNGYHVSGYKFDEASNTNIGFARINSGIIKNFRLHISFFITSSSSNVNIGIFAGINKGTIINCSSYLGSSNLRCDASGDSNAGVMVGINEGTVEDCNVTDNLYGKCNLGIIAGKNSGFIRRCNCARNVEYTDKYRDCAVGGVVGLQTGGYVKNCSFSGRVFFNNLDSYSNPNCQPCMGIIVGRLQGGSVSDNTWKKNVGSSAVVVMLVTNVTDKIYIRNEECGRIG